MADSPFDLESLLEAHLPRAVRAAARPTLSWILRLNTCRDLYERARSTSHPAFESRALDVLGVQPRVDQADVARIPERGALLVAANHPHGVLDGLLLAAVLRRVRSDVRILCNYLLASIPELQDLCFFVDPFARGTATIRSRAGLRDAHLWLRNGGTLVVFPAGEVAHRRRSDGGRAESPWHSTSIRLASATGAQVLPSFIEGGNSRLFYAAGRVHRNLRTLLLLREMLNKRGRTIAVRFGPPVDPMEGIQAVRNVVERLRSGGSLHPGTAAVRKGRADSIAAELAKLPAAAHMVDSGPYDVFCARAHQIPSALREIGRLREIAYGAIGEGTDRELDLDVFDETYSHLFVWDRRRQQIVGAYRIGRTDRIMADQGVRGLYTRTLFRYDARLIARLSPALELGRSFIRPEYQRNYNALLLLWKGIGRFVVRHPEYRVLFGPVSISTRYSDHSHRLLMTFLEQNHLDDALAELVNAVNPASVEARSSPIPVPASIEEMNRLVSRTESDGKGIPVLLRQYLKLNARLIGFNLDPEFGDAIDALMFVDLTKVDRSILNRYLGREAGRYPAFHRSGAIAPDVAA
jgi:putative hemolysin